MESKVMNYNRKSIVIGVMKALENKETVKFKDLVSKVGNILNYSDEIIYATTPGGTYQFDINVSTELINLKNLEVIDNKKTEYWKITNEKNLSTDEIISTLETSEKEIIINKESNEDILNKKIAELIEQDKYINKLINSDKFYFEKAEKIWHEYLDFYISNDELDDILNKINEMKPYSTQVLLDLYKEDYIKYSFIITMSSIVAYVDSKAFNKHELNKYEDTRTMASTFIRQNQWFKNLIIYKKNGDKNYVTGVIRNVITFIELPNLKLSSFKSDKLEQFVKVFKPNISTQNYDKLCEYVYDYFNQFNIGFNNEKNRGLLYGYIIYRPEIRYLWEKKKDDDLIEILGESIYPSIDRTNTDIDEYKKIKYDKKDILKEVFIKESKIDDILFNIDYKKNIILQGPPGVGKTFVAQKLCYLHQGYVCNDQIEMVQFHQSYSYEDFIRGYRPDKNGGFILKDGVFYKFAQKAINNPNNNYYFIIDEINRGNLSKRFC